MESKSYLVIARKYRPQNFEEVVGQEPIATTLKNAVALGRVGHAYLFTGPRGVGKTSVARIFAKALNCLKGPTVKPCGECPACQEIEGSRSLDVLEIDGASNRGIDEIRALRENVKFAPALGKFKIYIIDEVHQITPEAFNALLKTLEEPPPHVKFIFATTASHKVPLTILSRCQRFDFKRIPPELIAGCLGEICKKEKIRVDEDALLAIAKAADGSLRDAQSLLDQMASLSEGRITRDQVSKSLGMLEEETLVELMDALARQDAKSALLTLDAAMKEGKEPSLFLEKLLEHVRNLLFLHVSDELSDLVDANESYKKSLRGQKDQFSQEDLFYFFSVITHTLQIMKRFEMKRIPLEIALVKLARKAPLVSLSQVLDELKSLEKKTVKIENEPMEAETEELPSGELLPMAENQEKKSLSLDAVWQILLKTLRNEKISVASYLAETEPAGFHNRVAKISIPEKFSFFRDALETPENKGLIEKHLSSLLESQVRVEFLMVKDANSPVKTSASASGGESPPDPVTQSAMDIFGGKLIQGSS